MKTSNFNPSFRLKMRFALLLSLVFFSVYSYLYLDMQEPLTESFDVHSFVKSSIDPEEGMILLIVNTVKSLFGFV